jgi:hypothetical protein
MAGGQVEEIISLLSEDRVSSKESLSGLQVLISHISEDVTGLLDSFSKESNELEGVKLTEVL